MDDDDDFLYGSSHPPQTTPVVTPTPSLASSSFQSADGIIANLQAQAQAAVEASTSQADAAAVTPAVPEETAEEDAVDMDGEETDTEEDDEEDVEIIMEPQSRSLDFRQSRGQLRPTASNPALRAPQPSLTTEYTPIQRGGTAPARPTPQAPSAPPAVQTPTVPEPAAATPTTPAPATQPQPQPAVPPTAPPFPENADAAAATAAAEDGPDPSTLPPVSAPPSHPAIDPNAMGTLDGRAIIDVDLGAMADKQWRKPGADISDWFNYGFDELSWEAYCYRRRDLGEMANVLKTNVLNFSGMAEDQLTQMPPEVRTMVMTGTTAMMNGAAAAAGGAGMMNPGMMMDMGMMGPMGMGMNVNGDMGHGMVGVNGGMMPMEGAAAPGVVGVGMQGGEMQDGGMGVGGNPGAMMMDSYGGAGPDAAGQMAAAAQLQQQQQQQQQQQMYADGAGAGVPPTGPGAVRGGPGMGMAAAPYRARGMRGVRGGGFVGGMRGRGRGYGVDGSAPVAPARPTSPLPPNVPTGPRNQNKYKDRDGNAPAVDGLDYGGGKEGRTPSGEPEDRGRKRRSSPGLDDGRSSKRR